MNIDHIIFDPEFSFKTSRSSGKGGQNVNKVSSKVELNFDVLNSLLIDEVQRLTILDKLQNRISKEGILQIVVQADRSQLKNKEDAVKKFYQLLHECFKPIKIRRKTKPSKGKKEKRLKGKKLHSDKKELRRKLY